MAEENVTAGLDEGVLKGIVESIQKLIGGGSFDDILGMVTKILGAKGSIDGIVDAVQGLFGNAISKEDITSVASGMLEKGDIDATNVLGLFQGLDEKVGGFDSIAELANLGGVADKVSGAAEAAAGAAAGVAEGTRRVTKRASEVTGETVEAVSKTVDQAKPAKEINLEPNKKKKKWPVVLGVILGVLVIAGAGMWVWHEQPSFCNAFCHTPMDPFLATYDQESGQPGTDKWGNEVSDAHAMLVVSHKDANVQCLNCHVPSLAQQMGEVVEEVTGNYYFPLEERNLEQLIVNAGGKTENMGDEFCLKSGCHEFERKDMASLTSDMKRNPHMWLAGSHMNMEFACSDCHKSHRASVNLCSQCHDDADLPSGWVSAADGNKILKNYANAA